MASTRTRNWMTIVYPESAPSDWESLLADECVPAIRSPLHDKDVNPTGEPKKAHYHVMLMFSGVKTMEQVQEICSHFGGIQPRSISNAQGMARYFIHMDNPEKYQYNREDIRNFSGADWSSLVQTSKDRYDTLDEIIEECVQKKIISYSDLVNHYRMTNRRKFEVACDNTVLLTNFLKSHKWTLDERRARETGVRFKPIPDRSIESDSPVF